MLYSLNLFTEEESQIVRAFSSGSVKISQLVDDLGFSSDSIAYRLKLIRLKMHARDLDELAYKLCVYKMVQFNPEFQEYNIDLFTSLEKKILFLIVQGIYKPDLIAQRVNLKLCTVKSYLNNLRNKMHCSRTSELILKLFQSGIAQELENSFNN